jgi:patatin-like phospholipase/acyl hydrolase
MTSLTRILSIDGGGIRGIIPAQVLVALERKLQRKTGDPTTHIADHFDLIAGTSTGGILTCIYLSPDPEHPARPRFSAEQAVDLYLRRGAEIFSIPLWHKIKSGAGAFDERYPADGLEKALKDLLGDLKLSQLLKPCLITAYDIKRRRTVFFTQYDAQARSGRDFRARDVARATSAAPTYFECANVTSRTRVRYPMIDGSVFANNPALCAFAEARHALPGKPRADQTLILSLGTGLVKTPYDYAEAKDWGAVGWIRPLIDIMMSGAAETVDYQLGQIFSSVGKPQHYLRIDTALDPRNADMDNASAENLAELRDIGQELSQTMRSELDRFAEMLLEAAPPAAGRPRRERSAKKRMAAKK